MLQKTKNKPLVSVVVPAFNEEKHIEDCLKSIKGQTYPNIELIVIDDGSTDFTKEIVQKYADVFLIQQHQGPGTARNKAAKIAKGSILIFIDADMYLDKNYIRYIIEPIIDNKAVATFTKDEYIANRQNTWVRCYIYDNNLKENKKNIESFSQYSYFRAILKEYFLEKGGYNTKLGYNDDCFFTINDKEKIACAKGAICYHYNPDRLKDVFLSARWIGRSPTFKKTIHNVLRYSILNSILISIKKINKGAPLIFFIYKCVFDFGILCGILFKNIDSNYAK